MRGGVGLSGWRGDMLTKAAIEGIRIEVTSDGFRLALGTAVANVHPIVRWVDTFVTTAVEMTNPWNEAALAAKHGPKCPDGI